MILKYVEIDTKHEIHDRYEIAPKVYKFILRKGYHFVSISFCRSDDWENYHYRYDFHSDELIIRVNKDRIIVNDSSVWADERGYVKSEQYNRNGANR